MHSVIFYNWDFTWNQILGNLEVKNLSFEHIWRLLILTFYEFRHFLKVQNYQINILRAPKMAKTAVLELLDYLKLISRKVWVTEKFWNFLTVGNWCRTFSKEPHFSAAPEKPHFFVISAHRCRTVHWFIPHTLCGTQILREIKFEEFWSSNNAFFAQFLGSELF